MDTYPQIAFVILTWNSSEYITQCLESIDSFTSLTSRIIVVDNGSEDPTVSLIKQASLATDLELITNARNKGTTVARNMALSSAKECPFVCILDSDTVVNESAFMQMISALESDRTIGVVGPNMRTSNGEPQLSGRNLPSLGIKLRKALPLRSMQQRGSALEEPDQAIIDGIQNVPYLLSACWLLRSSVVDEVGALDENIFYAPEDVDYCVRVWNAGYRVVKCWNANIVHNYQRISKKRLFSRMNLEHIRGLVYYFKKYGYLFHPEKLTKTWRLYQHEGFFHKPSL